MIMNITSVKCYHIEKDILPFVLFNVLDELYAYRYR